MLHNLRGLIGSFIYILTISRTKAYPSELELRAIDVTLKYCLDLGNEFDSRCWEILGLSEWLRTWKKTTPVCGPSATHHCCTPEEPWTTCFMRIGYGGPGSYCIQINENSCQYSLELSSELAENEKPMFKYILYNIQSINIFFSTWYTAMEYAVSQASDTITSIVQLIDPKKKTNLIKNDILLAIGIGVAFLFLPELAPFVSDAGKRVGRLLLAGIQQSPTVLKAIWPIGTEDSQIYQIADLSESLFKLMPELEGRISEGLHLVQSDVEIFLAFTESGNFSLPGDLRPSLPNQTEHLLIAFTTFLVSSALAGNGWNTLMAVDVNPLGIAKGTAPLPLWTQEPYCEHCGNWTNLDLDCQQYDANNQCNYWYYSTSHKSAYTLGEGSKRDPTDIISSIFDQKWSTGPLLFENAGVCNLFATVKKTPGITPISIFHDTYSRSSIMVEVPTSGSLIPYETCIHSSTINGTCHKNVDIFSYIISQATSHENDSTWDFSMFSVNMNHPNNTLFNITSSGNMDFSCTSQLNLAMLTDWNEIWALYRHY
ncbi:MAG: hypothetical protein M1836_003735 [Candelina mexicana]|nr:MAG: hypothetical protein M1836_003735 [Candelina mexicana]